MLDSETPIAALLPSMWLSASNFDGAHAKGNEVITGDVSGRRTDSVGNTVTPSGVINVVDDAGHSAYYFNSTNAIRSSVSVSENYTFVYVYRLPDNRNSDRTFTGTGGNYLFGPGGGGVGELFLKSGWVLYESRMSHDIECFVVTSNAGTKNMWDVRNNQQVLSGSRAGENTWGQTIIGKPLPEYNPSPAGYAYVYEALVFDYALSSEQREFLSAEFKRKYGL